MEILLLPLLLAGVLAATFDFSDGDSADYQEDDDFDNPSQADSGRTSTEMLDLRGDLDENHEQVIEPSSSEKFAPKTEDNYEVRGDSIFGNEEGNFIDVSHGLLEVYAGGGDDTIVNGDTDTVTVEGGSGEDNFLLMGLIETPNEAIFDSSQMMTVTDFDPGEDTLGLIFDSGNIGDLSISSKWDPHSEVTDVKVIQEFPGGEPPSCLIAHFRLEGVKDFDPQELQFFVGDDRQPLSFELEGTAQNDILTGGHPSGSTAAMGYGGDDLIVTRSGQAFGGAGNDIISDDAFVQGDSSYFGEDGNDVLSGTGELYGGDGDDVLTLSPSGTNYGSERQDYTLGGIAVGGNGDDTIEASALPVGSEHYATVTISDELHIDAGAGNDLIRFTHGLNVVAGVGDDIVIQESTWQSQSDSPSNVVLGSGHDAMFLSLGIGHAATHTSLDDFDPDEDRLGLILRPEHSQDLTLEMKYDPSTNSTRVGVDIGIDEVGRFNSFTLAGINCETTKIVIDLFADKASAMTGNAYRSI